MNKSKSIITNPCVGDCRLNDEDICVGCGRLEQERLDWLVKTEAQRQKITRNANMRLIKIKQLPK